MTEAHLRNQWNFPGHFTLIPAVTLDYVGHYRTNLQQGRGIYLSVCWLKWELIVRTEFPHLSK
jgi:hypothetical protein